LGSSNQKEVMTQTNQRAECQESLLTDVDPSTTNTFEFTIVGQLAAVEKGLCLVCRDSTTISVSKPKEEYPSGEMLWQVIPSTDSTGTISNLSIVDVKPTPTEDAIADVCQIVGRVVQLGKRHQCVQFKVKRPGEKTLKLTLLNPDSQMKVGQMWSCTAVRVGCALHVREGMRLEETTETTDNQPLSKECDRNSTPESASSLSASSLPLSPEPQAPTHLATAALEQLSTEPDNWLLLTPTRRRVGWEWEATNSLTGQRARIHVGGRSSKAKIYHYPPPASDLPVATDATHLVVRPLGAALGIGASCFQVEIGPYEIVLDCGTRPKGYDPLPALNYLKNPDLLLISHAHQDHIGAVPVFHSRFSGVRMICTPGTREIAHIMLQDCLKVQQLNEDSPALFDKADLTSTLFRLETQPIGTDFEPLPGLKVRFINAGHIVGAACIYLRYGERSLLYTGDYNTSSSRTTEGLRLADLPQADILITESTYGGDTHPARKNQETALISAIASVVQAGGNVLIPAFALGRAQEILLAIRTSELFHKLSIPVYVDGLVRAVTDVFRDNLELLPLKVQNFASQKQEPFFDEKSQPPIIPIASPRERPLAIAKPSVIVASSGMLTGGPSVYYATLLLERENAAVFISGYTDEESPGRMLQNLQTGDTIELDGKEITVRAQVKRFNLSAHADKVGLTQVIHRVNPKHLILIHGSRDALHELARSGELQKKHYIHIPAVGEAVEFGSVPAHISRSRIAQISLPQEFEVNVEAEVDGAWLRIPASVVESDPRWQMLSAKGILRAKWDGINLKLSPLNEQHLAIETAQVSGVKCCAMCQHFNNKKSQCQCADSPLSGLVVDPAGHCLEYTSLKDTTTYPRSQAEPESALWETQPPPTDEAPDDWHSQPETLNERYAFLGDFDDLEDFMEGDDSINYPE